MLGSLDAYLKFPHYFGHLILCEIILIGTVCLFNNYFNVTSIPNSNVIFFEGPCPQCNTGRQGFMWAREE